jgi:hypothetical protein
VSDPFLRTYWTIYQVIVWAQFRNPEIVREVAQANLHPDFFLAGLRAAAELDRTITFLISVLIRL